MIILGHCFLAVGLRALRPCRNKPEQTGWHKFFLLPKWRSDTSYVTWLKLSPENQNMLRSKMLITGRTRGIFPQLSLEGEST
mmetsp:Transcript_19845/g.41482  ORF Transcript_19845/g.41482 Transcript_19845/m.41482 type:complete len:82 (-) Transcript_19845:69-314(-)